MIQRFFQNQWEKAKNEFWLLKNDNLSVGIFSLLSFLLPTQLSLHFWPSFAFVNGIKIDYLSPTLYVTDILSLLGITLLFLQNKKEIGIFLKTHQTIFYLATLFLLLPSLSHPSIGLYFYGVVKLLEYLFLFFCFAYLFQKEKITCLLLSSFLFGVFVQLFLALFQFFSQASIGGVWYWFGERTFSSGTPGISLVTLFGELFLRPYGTLPHPNVLGGVSAIVVWISYFQFEETKKKIYLALSLCGVFLTLLTFSRTASFALLLSFLVFFFWGKKVRNKWVFLLLLFLCGGSALTFFFSDTALTTRLLYYTQSIFLFREYPLGVGFRSYLYFLGHLQSVSSYSLFHPVHNIFVLFLVEQGILLSSLVGYVFWKEIKKRKVFHKKAVVLFLLLFCLGMNDHYLLSVQQGALILVFTLSYGMYGIWHKVG